MENKDNILDMGNGFKGYYINNIAPLLGELKNVKSKYKQKFWVFFWSALAINCVNVLFLLFNVLIRGKNLVITDITTLLFFSVVFVLVPFYMYNKENKPDYINMFFNFFGNFQTDNNKGLSVDSIFIPVGDKLITEEQVEGKLSSYHLNVVNVQSKVKLPKVNIERVISKGIYISMVMPIKMEHTIFWDKNAYNKNCNVKNLSEIQNINIPIANYFHIFSDNSDGTNNLLNVSFFEALLDIKDVFYASKINVETENETISIYLEDAKFPLFVKDSLMKPCLQEKDFQKACEIVEKIVVWGEIVEELSSR
jgi:hypothetical protein